MEPGSRRAPEFAGRVSVIIADAAWRRVVRNPEAVVARAAAAAGGVATVVLTSDRVVKQLNARHRGRNKPTNVLTFEAAFGAPGEILLALGTVRREADAAGRRPAHLVVHGSLHLQGHDHQAAGEARRMELREARIMGGMRLPNPWRPA
jgi:probable rRNA maturation factor